MTDLPFAAATLDTLFAAILIDDEIDDHVSLPDPIPLDPSIDDLRDCFRLCRQLWTDGVDRAEAIRLVHLLLHDGDLNAENRLKYKYIRAKYKHLRFAFTLYDSRHACPPRFKLTTTIMGHLQDAFRNGQRYTAIGYAVMLRVLLMNPFWNSTRREAFSAPLDDQAGFTRFMTAEIGKLRAELAKETLNGAEFHAMRKIISRHVSFFDTLRTLRPTDSAYKMSRYLSAINGMMGSMHDDLVERGVSGEQDYHRHRFALPAEIRERLQLLVDRYPA
ncbi:hypothetical protein [Flavisphingomonas formosensis]|uniref:hypothetical protein n=1 Tax=Flavisphingomonas formosensis TaxID=861534 RepID=UPI0012FCD9B8|nr:hypothetical protein [Sphingomonas formosensis]